MQCPWTGMPCDCEEFPYKRHGVVPRSCERIMCEQMPELIPVRSVSQHAKEVHVKYLADVKAGKYRDILPPDARGVRNDC